MAAGKLPFDGPTNAVIFEGLLTKPPAPLREKNPKISRELERIVYKALEKDREMRYQSAADLRADLKRVECESGSGRVAIPPSQFPPPPRHTKQYAVAAVAALALIAAGIFWWQMSRRPPLTDRDVVVMADFANTTGDAVFDGALRQALAIQLEQLRS
ncbi:MAG: hypothetical protein ABSB35_26205 [Bryobacteraceae bacterium]|jgi:serine/threonine protein kinase